jgi:hypothetical protein
MMSNMSRKTSPEATAKLRCESAEVDQRLLLALFHPDQRGKGERRHRKLDERSQRRGPHLGQGMQAGDQSDHEDREHDEPHPVHRTGPTATGPGMPPQDERRRKQHDDVEPEVGAPSRVVGHDSAD